MIFEKAAANDFETIKQLYWDLIDYMDKNNCSIGWRKGIYPSDEFISESIEKGCMWVLKGDNGICSAVILNSCFNDGYRSIKWNVECDEEEILVPHALAVKADLQGNGIGSVLMKNIIEFAKETGKKTIRLDIMSNNASAEKLYLKNGFVFAEEKQIYYKEAGWAEFKMFEKVL